MSLEEDRWSNLPTDILNIILWRIPLFYHPTFASVCKKWNAICMHKLHLIEETDPLLIYKSYGKRDTLNYYSPVWNKTYNVKSQLALSWSSSFSTNDGWLIEHCSRKGMIVLANPATGSSYSYPGLQRDDDFFITFSGCPGTKDFVIFCIDCKGRRNLVFISVWKQGEWKLQSARYESQVPFDMSRLSSPVLHKGCFYCISRNGNLGVFDLEKETWDVLMTNGFSTSTYCEEVYLIESEGKMIAVVGHNFDPFLMLVFRLSNDMLWEQITNLETQSLFVGFNASFMADFGKQVMNARKKGKPCQKVDVNVETMGNRVYTTKFYGMMTEAVEAEMKISQGRLFFLTKASDNGKNKNVSWKNGNLLSFSLQSRRKPDNYHGSTHWHVHSAWYKPKF